MSQLTEDEAKLSRIIEEISGDSPITKSDSNEFRELLQNQQIRKVVEMRLDMAKTLKDDYMVQLFTDILRGR